MLRLYNRLSELPYTAVTSSANGMPRSALAARARRTTCCFGSSSISSGTSESSLTFRGPRIAIFTGEV